MKTEASSLLRIDFDAAIDKLAGAQLQGTWQLPAELARLAIASGARSVDFDIESRHFVMTAPGARWDQRTVADFASVLDRRLEAADRHRAMVDLEERGAFVLSAITSSSLRSVALTLGGEEGLKLTLTAAGDLDVVLPPSGDAGGTQPDVRLRVEGLAIDAERAAVWLRRAGRFSSIPISIDGVKIAHGFHAPLIEKRLEVSCQREVHGTQPKAAGGDAFGPAAPRPAAGLPTMLAISGRGSTPRLWLLRHGIIATHATVPGYPAFEAAIEMAADGDAASPRASGPAAPRVTSAALREALGPYLESLVDASVGLMIELGQRAEGGGSAAALPEQVRARVARLLLRSALKRRRLSEVSGVRIFPLLNAEGRSLVSIDLVGRLVRVEEGGDCALDAVAPAADPKRYAVAGRGALAISQGERALLGELLSVVFSRPPARARQSLMRRLRERAFRRLPALGARGAPVGSSELSAAERGLLARLADAEEAGAEFRTGRDRVRRDAAGKLLLPRDNAAVAACVRAVERDAAWLYPATVALLDGRELPGPEMRRQWYARLD